MPTPKRITRSNSTSGLNLADIQQLILDANNDIKSFFKQEIEKVHSLLSKLTTRVQNIEENLTSMEERIDKHDEAILHINESLSHFSNGLPNEAMDEIENRLHRRTNLVISGLQELSQGTVEEKRAYDLGEVKKIAVEIGVSDIEINHTMRIGKHQDGRPRLLKIVCAHHFGKMEMLRNGKLLRNSTSFERVFINPDLTPKQQVEAKKLREELNARRDRQEDVIIHRNKIIPRSQLKNFR